MDEETPKYARLDPRENLISSHFMEGSNGWPAVGQQVMIFNRDCHWNKSRISVFFKNDLPLLGLAGLAARAEPAALRPPEVT